jgi:thiamine-monophosphate kinase
VPSEFDFIDWIRKQQRPNSLVQLGVGDDMAILNWPAADLLLIGVDQVLDTVHFDSNIHTPTQIGRKVMNRNLSDCAAMACLPAAAVATLAAPRDFSLAQSQDFYLAMRAAADAFNCPIVGGDTSSWDGKLLATVTILGRSAGVRPITRAGAKPGDGIFVTGPLGGSILGRHLDFTPRIDLGRQLANFATAMIDTSDGISRDITHICKASHVGAILESANIPIHPDAIELSRRDGISPPIHALNDGEDYELLFTSTTQPPVGIRIGRIIPEPGIWIESPDTSRTPLAAKGWLHNIA